MFNKSLFIAPITTLAIITTTGCSTPSISFVEAKKIVEKTYDLASTGALELGDDLDLKYLQTHETSTDGRYEKYVQNVERTYSKTRLYIKFDFSEEYKTNKENVQNRTFKTTRYLYVLDNYLYTVVDSHDSGVTKKVYTKERYNIEKADEFTDLLTMSLSDIKDMLIEINTTLKYEFNNFEILQKDKYFTVSLKSEADGSLDSNISGHGSLNDAKQEHNTSTVIRNYKTLSYNGRMSTELTEDNVNKKTIEEFDFSMNYSQSLVVYPNLNEFTLVEEI